MKKLRQTIHLYPFNFAEVNELEFFAPRSAALYLHIPFCRRKCHFCDFTVYLNKNMDVREAYVQALCEEIRTFSDSRSFPAFTIESIYVGGGTPGLLTAEQLALLIQTCRDSYPVAEDCEISVEFDPHAVTPEKLAAAVESGVSRASMGVQSFDDRLLRESNRPHDAETATQALRALVASDIRTVNIDLIYPLPGLTMDVWLDTVAQAIALEPAAITTYGLEVWPGTVFHRRLLEDSTQWPSSEVEVEMYFNATEMLEKAGFIARSVNGYLHPERSDQYSRYLDFYWNALPTIGFGVSARSAVDDRMWTNVKAMPPYLGHVERGEPPIEFGRRLSKLEEIRRRVIRGLKACQLDKAAFEERYGVAMDVLFGPELRQLVDDGLIVDDEKTVCLTPLGRALANNVYARFCAPGDSAPLSVGEVSIGRSMLIDA